VVNLKVDAPIGPDRPMTQLCPVCGRMPASVPFRLTRFQDFGLVSVTKTGSVLLCESCHRLFTRANRHRVAGGITIFGGLLLGAFIASMVGLVALWIWPVCIAVGLCLVSTGRKRVAALEKLVRF
jgi:hypothetical protein